MTKGAFISPLLVVNVRRSAVANAEVDVQKHKSCVEKCGCGGDARPKRGKSAIDRLGLRIVISMAIDTCRHVLMRLLDGWVNVLFKTHAQQSGNFSSTLCPACWRRVQYRGRVIHQEPRAGSTVHLPWGVGAVRRFLAQKRGAVG